MLTLNCHLYLSVTAHIRPSSAQRRHYGAVGTRELLRPYLLWIPSVIRFRFNGRRSLLQSALRRFILHPLDSCNFEHSRGNYVTVLILMRIATRMRDCQCFPSSRHKEINKNTLREALPFLFWTLRDVMTPYALRYVPKARWRRPEKTTHLSDFRVYFVEVSVSSDINGGCDAFHYNSVVKPVAYWVNGVFLHRALGLLQHMPSAMLEQDEKKRVCWHVTWII